MAQVFDNNVAYNDQLGPYNPEVVMFDTSEGKGPMDQFEGETWFAGEPLDTSSKILLLGSRRRLVQGVRRFLTVGL